MSPEYFTKIGYLKKTKGVRGDIYLWIEAPFVNCFEQVPFVSIRINGDYVPFFIENLLGSEGEYIVKFDDIHNPEDARKLTGCGLYISKEQWETCAASSDTFVDKHLAFRDYRIIADGYPEDMFIQKITEYPAHLMAEVTTGEQHKLIPFIEEWILEIHHDQKQITMDLPEGL